MFYIIGIFAHFLQKLLFYSRESLVNRHFRQEYTKVNPHLISLQSPLKAGLYLYERIIFLSLKFWGFYCVFCGQEKHRNLCTKRVHTMFTSVYCKHCNYYIINVIRDIFQNNIRLQAVRQNRILTLSLQLFKISTSERVQRKVVTQSRFVSISLCCYRSYGQYHRTSIRVIF